MTGSGNGTAAVKVEPKVEVKSEPPPEVKTEPGAEVKGEPSTSKDAEAGPSGNTQSDVDFDELLKAFLSDLKDVDRDNEVNRILWAFKLNPYEKLNLRFDAPFEDVRKQFRKLSLMVHPDKCKHPQASAAFDILKDADAEISDDEKREHLMKIFEAARELVRTERRKETKHDNLVKMATLLHEDGRDGVEAQWEQTDEFHEKWKMKAREALAQMEWRKRKLGKRLKEETARLEGIEKEQKTQHKKIKQAEKEWEATREQRVGTWRDFMEKKKGESKTVGELRPPPIKANDEDKLYVRRKAGPEELRPQQAPSRGRKDGNPNPPRPPPPTI